MKNRVTVAHVLLACAIVVRSLQAAAGHCDETWQFDCGNGLCIEPHKMCDGSRECGNGADEMACTPDLLVCPPCSFACHNQARCVRPIWVCDGDKDCRDGSDEMDCPEARAAALKCNLSTRPQPASATPSADTAFPDATSPTSPTRECSVGDGDFSCPDGRCLLAVHVCDGVRDCSDGADEGRFCQLLRRESHQPQQHRQERRGWLVDLRVQFRALIRPLLNPYNLTNED